MKVIDFILPHEVGWIASLGDQVDWGILRSIIPCSVAVAAWCLEPPLTPMKVKEAVSH